MKQKGFSLIEILIALVVFIIIAAAGVVMWKKKVSPTVTPAPTPLIQPTPIPTFVPEVKPSPKPISRSKNGCLIWGCNGELCLDENSERRDTICRWLPQHECFRSAICERQADGHCAWTQTPELKDCLNKF